MAVKLLYVLPLIRDHSYKLIITYTFSTLPFLLDFTHSVRRSNNPSVREKKAKRDKAIKKKEKYTSDLREKS
jgi:hypothetical protein